MARTQIQFTAVSGSLPSGGGSATAASGMSVSAHGSLKDTLDLLASSIARIHGSTDWSNVAEGIFNAATKHGTQAGSGVDAHFYTAGTAAHVGLHWDADGNTEGTLIGGADDHGVDFKFFGESSGKYVQWDMSGDELVLASSAKLSFHDAAGDENIVASADGHLEINSGTTLDMTAPTVDINASTAVTLDTPSVVVASSTTDKPDFVIKNTNDDATGPELQLTLDTSSSAAADDVAGTIKFIADDAGNNQTEYGRIQVTAAAVTAGSESGKLALGVATTGSGAYANVIEITGGATAAASTTVIKGHLQVDGTTTTVNSTTVTIDDPIFTLGGDTAPSSSDSKDRGIEFRYYADSAARIGFMGWDDSASGFTLLSAASNSSEVFSGTAADLVMGGLTATTIGATGACTLASSSGVTTIGSTTGATISAAGVLNVNNATDSTAATNGSLQTDGGLGVVKDIIAGADVKLLSDSSSLSLGEDSDATFTHDGTTGLTIAATPISVNSTGDLTLDSSTDIVLDAAGADIILKHNSTESARLTMASTTSVELAAIGDIILDPAGGNVQPGSDGADTLGLESVWTSNSEASISDFGSNANTSVSIDMTSSRLLALQWGSSISAGSGSSISNLSNSNIGSADQIDADTTTIIISGSPSSVSVAAGTLIGLSDSSGTMYFYVTEAYSSGSSLYVDYAHNIASNASSLTSCNNLQSFSPSSSSAYGGGGITADKYIQITVSGTEYHFQAKSTISTNGLYLLVDPLPGSSTGGATTYTHTTSPSSVKTNSSAPASRVAWAGIETDSLRLNDVSGAKGIAVTQILDEDAMGSNSDTALATQQSIKAYVDSQAFTPDLWIQVATDTTSANNAFTISGSAVSGSTSGASFGTSTTLNALQVFVNGQLQYIGSGKDVTVTGTKELTFTYDIVADDVIAVHYYGD